uniref:Reverse transcriptase domain-containing protein n=1 Tax=Caenorhabditis tropicalis TaxID=1561998 RepID=A0A1I7TGC2_9PELO
MLINSTLEQPQQLISILNVEGITPYKVSRTVFPLQARPTRFIFYFHVAEQDAEKLKKIMLPGINWVIAFTVGNMVEGRPPFVTTSMSLTDIVETLLLSRKAANEAAKGTQWKDELPVRLNNKEYIKRAIGYTRLKNDVLKHLTARGKTVYEVVKARAFDYILHQLALGKMNSSSQYERLAFERLMHNSNTSTFLDFQRNFIRTAEEMKIVVKVPMTAFLNCRHDDGTWKVPNDDIKNLARNVAQASFHLQPSPQEEQKMLLSRSNFISCDNPREQEVLVVQGITTRGSLGVSAKYKVEVMRRSSLKLIAFGTGTLVSMSSDSPAPPAATSSQSSAPAPAPPIRPSLPARPVPTPVLCRQRYMLVNSILPEPRQLISSLAVEAIVPFDISKTVLRGGKRSDRMIEARRPFFTAAMTLTDVVETMFLSRRAANDAVNRVPWKDDLVIRLNDKEFIKKAIGNCRFKNDVLKHLTARGKSVFEIVKDRAFGRPYNEI